MLNSGEHNDNKAYKLAKRFSEMKRQREPMYFDVDEFETIADHFFESGNLGNADEAIHYGLSIHPASIPLKLWMARIFIERGRYESALEVLQYLVKIQKHDSEVFLLLGDCYLHQGNTPKAVKAFNKALNLSEPSSEDRKDLYYRIVVIYETLYNFEAAVSYLERSHKEFPKDLNIIYDLALACEKTGDYEKSTDFFDQYLKKDPFSETAWFNLGVSLSRQGIFDAAAQANDFAIAIAPDYAAPYFNKGRNLFLLGEYDEAISSFHDYLEFHPGNIDTYQCLGECYENIENYTAALKYYNLAIEKDDSAHEAHVGVATVLLYQGRYEEGYNHMVKAMEQHNSNPHYWFIYSNLCMHTNRQNEAGEAFERVITLKPDYYLYWLNYADLLFANDQMEAAVHTLQRSLHHLPENAMLNYRLAAYLLLWGNKEEAMQYLRKAFHNDPQSSHYFTDIYAEEGENIEITSFFKDQ